MDENISDPVVCNNANGGETEQGSIGEVNIDLVFFNLTFQIEATTGEGSGSINDAGAAYGYACDVNKWTRRQATQINIHGAARWMGQGNADAEAWADSVGWLDGTITLTEIGTCP